MVVAVLLVGTESLSAVCSGSGCSLAAVASSTTSSTSATVSESLASLLNELTKLADKLVRSLISSCAHSFAFAKLIASASSIIVVTSSEVVAFATRSLYDAFSSSDKYAISSIWVSVSACCSANSSANLASATICSTAATVSAFEI